MSDANFTGDSSDLEALFDSIASGTTHTAAAPPHTPPPAAGKPSLMQQAREND